MEYIPLLTLTEALDELAVDTELEDRLDRGIGEEDEYEPALVFVDEKW